MEDFLKQAQEELGLAEVFEEQSKIDNSENVKDYEEAKKKEEKEKKDRYFNKALDFKYKDFDPKNLKIDETNKPQLMALSNWVNDFKQGKWLIINGKQGNGKTLMKNVIIKSLYEKKQKKVYSTSMFEISIDYVDSFKNGNTRQLFNKLTEAQILVIDEVGRRKISESLFDFLFAIFDHYYLKKKSLILVSNLDITEESLGQYVDIDRVREVGDYVTFNSNKQRSKK
jgi:DNA replication protein DnaC